MAFFTELVWRALRTVVVMPAGTRADPVPESCLPASKPCLPLWCAMVTRTVSLKCEEAQEAKEAVAKEVAYHVERDTWDLLRVRELSEWMRDDAYSEVLVGRVFVILGVKFAEMAKSERKFRARAVYQVNNVWSRSGRSVYEIFDEVSNSPSSLMAARTAMAVGMLREMRASYRDASNAYLQALIDVEPCVINLVELPRSWWPRSWFEDDAMTIPKYKRLAVPLVYALPGHPKSGNVWEEHAETILAKLGWRKVEDWTGVFVHADMSVICLYVDDFMMVATDDLERQHWDEIGKHIEFKEEAALLARYLGDNYNIDKFSLMQPDRARQIRVSMTNYLLALVARSQDDHPDAKLYPVTSPYLPEAQWADANDQPGVYHAQCASYVASALFASLAGRLDISTAVWRLTTRITRWTVPDDAALVRLMAHLKAEASLELVGTLSPDDVTGLQLERSTDADWNGNACTTRSVSGMHLELVNPKSGNVFPLAWRSSGQSATSCSTAESEVVALSHGLRHFGLPVQDLVQEFLGERIPLVCLVDNQQAITAVKRGLARG